MKKITKNTIAVLVLFFWISFSYAQKKTYTTSDIQLAFSQSDASFTQAFKDEYKTAQMVGNNLRFTIVLNIAQHLHVNFNDNIGIYTGLELLNIGMITDETLPQYVGSSDIPGQDGYVDYKIIKRQYTLGIPLALKLGKFSKNFYIYGGAKYEYAFVFKQKYWTNTFDRSGDKTKSVNWFGEQTPAFLPSAFAGVQLPGGINVIANFYLTDFLNQDYGKNKNTSPGNLYDISDNSRYEQSQLFYIGVTWQFYEWDKE